MKYPITEIFHSLQGEGHFVGYPMAFVRLAGCSVQGCAIRRECDEAPWKASSHLSPEEIVRLVAGRGIVCITGGEPTDHDLLPLLCALRDAGHRIHMETSGVRSVEGYPLDWLTVSPKILTQEGFVQRSGHTLKLVVRPEWTEDQLWEILAGLETTTTFFHRYLQPLSIRSGGSASFDQTLAAVNSPRNAKGLWALSTQAHRGWNVR